MTPVFAYQQDETDNELKPLTAHQMGRAHVIDALTRRNGPGGCQQEYFSWKFGPIRKPKNDVREQIDSWLPPGYSTNKPPQINIEPLSGRAGGWRATDANCRTSRLVSLRLTLFSEEVRAKDLAFITEQMPRYSAARNRQSRIGASKSATFQLSLSIER